MSTGQLPELPQDYSLFLNRTTVLYGPSSTGKSTIIANILRLLHPHTEQIFVVCPTDPSNATYSGKGAPEDALVPRPFIHYQLRPAFVEEFWKRQEVMAAVYKKANAPEVQRALVRRLALPAAEAALQQVEAERKRALQEIRETTPEASRAEALCEQAQGKFDELALLTCRKYVRENQARLRQMPGLSEAEQFALRYLGFNPHAVLILDDCAAEFAKLKKCDAFTKLFYQGRHNFVTTIISCQDANDLEAGLRKNAFVSVFSNRQTAVAFFENKTNAFDKEMKARAKELCETTYFSDPHPLKHQKMVYIRLTNEFMRFTAQVQAGLRMGSAAFREYARRIQADGASLDRTNPFFEFFV